MNSRPQEFPIPQEGQETALILFKGMLHTFLKNPKMSAGVAEIFKDFFKKK